VPPRPRLQKRVHATVSQEALTRSGRSDRFGQRGRPWWPEQRQALPPHTAYTPCGLLDTLELLSQPTDHVEQRMHEAFHQARAVALLMSLPGVCGILSAVRTSERGDVRRCKGADHLAAAGVHARRRPGSGGQTRDGPLRPAMNRAGQWALVEAAHASCRARRGHPQRHVSQRYTRLARPTGQQKTMGAVARQLAEAMHWLLSKGAPYRAPRSIRALGSSTEASARAGELSASTLDIVLATRLRKTFMPPRWRRAGSGETRTKRERQSFQVSLARRFQRCSP
jgi:Transposase IS116/IS110/IS902 family